MTENTGKMIGKLNAIDNWGSKCGCLHHQFQKSPFLPVQTKTQPWIFQIKTVSSVSKGLQSRGWNLYFGEVWMLGVNAAIVMCFMCILKPKRSNVNVA